MARVKLLIILSVVVVLVVAVAAPALAAPGNGVGTCARDVAHTGFPGFMARFYLAIWCGLPTVP
jgi:hypothetical protein